MTMKPKTRTPAKSAGAPDERADSSPATRGSRKNAPAAGGSRRGRVTTPEERRALIARSAYLKAERRGFQSSPEQDWLEAEAEFDTLHGGSGSPDERPERIDR